MMPYHLNLLIDMPLLTSCKPLNAPNLNLDHEIERILFPIDVPSNRQL